MNDTQFQKYLLYAENLAHQAADIMKQYYRSDYKKELKNDKSLVTVADLEINKMVIKKIKYDFPEHGVLGEEETWQADRKNLWVCDPIDSTASFIVHMPTFTFALAYVVNGVPLVAVAYNPMTDEMYSAVKNEGAMLNGSAIHVSTRDWGYELRLLRKASPLQLNVLDKGEVATELDSKGISLVANHGAVWSGALIAGGSADGYIYEGSSSHDVAAIKLIVEEAGGKVTDIDGGEQLYDRSINGAVVSNGIIHEKLIEQVKKYANPRN